MNMKKIFLVGAFSSLLILSGCGSSGGGGGAVVDLVTVSGQITDLSDISLQGVTIEGIYNNPGDPLNPTTTSDANGNYSFKVLKGDAVYLQARKATYTTMNSGKEALNANEPGFDIGMPTSIEAQDVINLVFTATTPNLADKAWLVVEVVSATTGEDVGGETIIAASTPAEEVYMNCFDALSGGSVTIAGCMTITTPMYMAYYDAGTVTTVTVGAETQTAVLRKGEVTILEFEQ